MYSRFAIIGQILVRGLTLALEYMPEEAIQVRGARVNNLKNVSVFHPYQPADCRYRVAVGPGSRPLPSTRFTPKDSAATSNRCPPTPASFWNEWTNRTSTKFVESHRPLRSDRRTRPKPALDGRHSNRNPRLPAFVVCPRWPNVLSRLWTVRFIEIRRNQCADEVLNNPEPTAHVSTLCFAVAGVAGKSQAELSERDEDRSHGRPSQQLALRIQLSLLT